MTVKVPWDIVIRENKLIFTDQAELTIQHGTKVIHMSEISLNPPILWNYAIIAVKI